MEVYLNRIDGWDDAILSMFYSKRTVTREMEEDIRFNTYLVENDLLVNPKNKIKGSLLLHDDYVDKVAKEKVSTWLDSLFKWAWTHITMGRFLDLSFTVYGLHRAGQDDLDAHAMRMNNRIIRSSTRLADFKYGEMSTYYQDKIVPTDVALAYLDIVTPDEIKYNGQTYVRAVNGYVLKGMENNKDVKRGLYMLSIPSNFIFRCNLTEFAHIYKERREQGTANPEVKQAVEMMADQLEEASCGYINREYLMKVKN